MKHTLRRDSWHYWLAKKWGGLNYWEGHDVLDICTYSRKVAKGLFLFTFWSIVAFIFGIAYLVGGYDFFACLLNPVCSETPPSSMLFLAINGFVACIFALACCGILINKYREYRYEHPVDKKDPSFLTLWYRKFKEKTCFIVSFED